MTDDDVPVDHRRQIDFLRERNGFIAVVYRAITRDLLRLDTIFRVGNFPRFFRGNLRKCFSSTNQIYVSLLLELLQVNLRN